MRLGVFWTCDKQSIKRENTHARTSSILPPASETWLLLTDLSPSMVGPNWYALR